MISPDKISRLQTAHANAVKAYGKWLNATPGTMSKRILWDRYENSEKKFDWSIARVMES